MAILAQAPRELAVPARLRLAGPAGPLRRAHPAGSLLVAQPLAPGGRWVVWQTPVVNVRGWLARWLAGRRPVRPEESPGPPPGRRPAGSRFLRPAPVRSTVPALAQNHFRTVLERAPPKGAVSSLQAELELVVRLCRGRLRGPGVWWAAAQPRARSVSAARRLQCAYGRVR